MSQESSIRDMLLEEVGNLIPKIPEGAITVRMIAEKHGLSVAQARNLMERQVKSGDWQKVHDGKVCWYWKDGK